jgi:hypothetical protein
MRKLIHLIVALIAISIAAEAWDDGSMDAAAPKLVGSVAGNVLTIRNIGTAPSWDFGGAKVLVGFEQVGILPLNVQLNPNPYWQGSITENGHGLGVWMRSFILDRPLVGGEIFKVTDGYSIYIDGVAQ